MRQRELNIKDAIALQQEWRVRVRIEPLAERPRHVAGVDVAFAADGAQAVAVAVLLAWPTMAVLEQAEAILPVVFPYVPGLLSFREAPVMAAALKGLSRRPDVLIVDGQGVAHPRRLGLAAHLGVMLDLPAVGCAKSRLIGTHREPGLKRGNRCQLKDGEEVIGTVLRTRDGVKCVYVSVGQRITLKEAERVVLWCCRGYRLPEPTRQGHLRVTARRRSLAVDMKAATV